MNMIKKLGLSLVSLVTTFCVQAEMRMELDRAYEFVFWKNGAGMECKNSHDHGGDENPWSFNMPTEKQLTAYGITDCGVAIPVYGCGADRITASVVRGSSLFSDDLSVTVFSDNEMAKRLGVIDYWNKFEYEGDDEEYECNVGRMEYYIPTGIWENGKVQDNRQWILISIKLPSDKNNGFWTPRSFAVGINGSNLYTPQITIIPEDEGVSLSSKDFFGIDVSFSRFGEDPTFSVEFEAWDDYHEGLKDYLGRRVYYTWDTECDEDVAEGGELLITAPSKGRIYCRLVDDWYPGEDSDNASRIKVVGGINVSGGSETDLVIDVMQKGLVKISGFEEKLCAYGLWFRPNSIDESECIAVEALYQENIKLANNIGQACYRCAVTGMGVSSFGDSVRLVCHPNEGEVFDHWEFVKKDKYGNYAIYDAPHGVDVRSTTLTFESTKELYDLASESIGGLKIVQVRPVLKPRRTIMVLPRPAGYAKVIGNGVAVVGESIAITIKPLKGCAFAG